MIELNLTIFDFIVVFFASGAIIVTVVLATTISRSYLPNSPANRWLVLLLLAVSTFLGTQIISFGGFHAVSPLFYYPPLQFTFSFGPLLYFYVRQTAKPEYRWQSRDWIHLILPMSQAILTIWLIFQSIRSQQQLWLSLNQTWYPLFDDIWTALSMIGYAFAAYWLLTTLQRHNAPIQTKKLYTTRQIVIIFLICSSITLVIDALLPPLILTLYQFNLYTLATYRSIPVIIYSVSLIWVAVKGLLVTQIAGPSPAIAGPSPAKRKERYGIEPDQLVTYAAALERLIQTEKPYLDPNLSLSKLAQQLELPTKHLSYIINETYGKSYNQFINELRIEAARAMLMDKKNNHQSILDIALKAGFNSKSTFNRIFRSQTGKTPSQIRAMHQ